MLVQRCEIIRETDSNLNSVGTAGYCAVLPDISRVSKCIGVGRAVG